MKEKLKKQRGIALNVAFYAIVACVLVFVFAAEVYETGLDPFRAYTAIITLVVVTISSSLAGEALIKEIFLSLKDKFLKKKETRIVEGGNENDITNHS